MSLPRTLSGQDEKLVEEDSEASPNVVTGEPVPKSSFNSRLNPKDGTDISPRRIRFDQEVNDNESSGGEDWDDSTDNKFDEKSNRYAIEKMQKELDDLQRAIYNGKSPLSSLKQRSMSFNIKSVVQKLNAVNAAEAAAIKAEKKARKKRLKKVFNFAVGTGAKTKLFRFEAVSLGFFTKHNRIRQFCVKLVASDLFQKGILALIVINAILIAACDYSYVDSKGDLLEQGSFVNALNANTNLFFVVCFALEMGIKLIAQGVYGRHGSYLSSSWNLLDFVVVITGILTYIDTSLENVSSFRIVRVLRPFRTLKMIPAMRSIISSIFASIPQLGGVFSLMGFILFLFAIIGMELFGDASQHARCRSTPYPVLNTYMSPHVDPASTHNFADFRCLPGPTFSYLSEPGAEELTQENSPWREPRNCYWPLAPYTFDPIHYTIISTRECSLSGVGLNPCVHDTQLVSEKNWSWCGSNFDAKGNQRFIAHGTQLYGNGFYPMNDIDMYHQDLNFGYSNFDNIGVSVLTIFQIVTQEGWTKILYLCMDSHGVVAIPFFVLLILFGVYFVLQLLLAVLEDNFSSASHKFAEAVKAEKLEMEYKLLQLQGDYSEKNIAIAIVHSSFVQRKALRHHLQILSEYTERKINITIFSTPEEFIHHVGKKRQETLVNEFHMLITGDIFPAGGKSLKEGLSGVSFVKYLNAIPRGPLFRLKHIIAISAAPETCRALFKEAGAEVTLENKPIDFDKSVSGIVDENDDIIHVTLNCLRLGLDRFSSSPDRAQSPEPGSRPDSPDVFKQLAVEDPDASVSGSDDEDDSIFRDSHGAFADSNEPTRASMQLEIASVSSDGASDEEKSIFRTKHAVHEYEENFRFVMRCGDNLMCCNSGGHTNKFDEKAVMQVLGKPLTGLLRKKCRICENHINYHYMRCQVCPWQICMECAANEWDSQTVYPGEAIDTPYGKCIVDEYRSTPAEGHHWHMNVPSIACTPVDWKLADGNKPKFHLNLQFLKPVEYGVGDEIICAYGGAGVIVGMRKSLQELGGIVYVVELFKWKLATGKSPVLYLSKPSILKKTKDNGHKRIANMEDLLSVLDHAASAVNPDHDQDSLAPGSAQKRSVESADTIVHHSPVRKLAHVRKSISNVTSESNLSTVTDNSRTSGNSSGGTDDFRSNNPNAITSSAKVALTPNRGIAGFWGKRMESFKSAILKTAPSGDTGSQTSACVSDIVDVSAAALVQRTDPNSFVHLNRLVLDDLIGTSAANCVYAVQATWSGYKKSLKTSCKKLKQKIFHPKEMNVFGLKKYKSYDELTGFEKLMRTVKANCLRLAHWKKFDMLSGGFIFLNSVILMCDHYPMTKITANSLDLSNAILTIIFTFEMGVNIIARGFAFYTKDFMSGFDGFVVIVSLVDLSLAPPVWFGDAGLDVSEFTGVSSTISLLRCFRLFRMVKLGLKIKSLKILLYRIVKTFYHLGAFVILLGVLLFCFTVAGLQFFANRFHFDEAGEVITDIGSPAWVNAAEISRSNFDDFSSSFASVFQLLTTENWNDIMFNCWRVYGPFGVLFPVIWLVLGTFILMNLFLGILLGNFTGDDEAAADEAIAAVEDLESKKLRSIPVDSDIGAIWGSSSMGNGMNVKLNTRNLNKASAREIEMISIRPEAVPLEEDNEMTDSEKAIFADENDSSEKRKEVGEEDVRVCCFCVPTSVMKAPKIAVISSKKVSILALDMQVDENETFPLPPINSCGLFSPTNSFRIMCGNIVASFYFEAFIQAVIFSSSCSLILDNPLENPDTPTSKAFAVFELISTVIFSMEMLVKVITFGFALNKRAYLRNSWNVLDFIIVTTSILSNVLSGSTFDGIKAIRSFRALRPLRVISRAPGLRIIVNALFESIPDVLNVVGVIVVLFTIFAVLGVNFLKGAMGTCGGAEWLRIQENSGAVNLLTYPVPYAQMTPVQQSWFSPVSELQVGSSFAPCTTPPCCNLSVPSPGFTGTLPTSRMICECWGGSWVPAAYQTFDNYPRALIAFIIISTTEGWIDLMYAAVDSHGIDMQPVRNQNYLYIYFFILFIVIGSFFALNLFVGVMIDNFGQVKEGQQVGTNGKGSMFMTPEQQEWIRTYQLVRLVKPHARKVAPNDRIGVQAYELCTHKRFETVVLTCITLNSFVLGSSYWGMSDKLQSYIDLINIVFAGVFTIEMALKVVAFRWSYLASKWNIFDGIVTLGTDAGVFWFLASGATGGMAIMVIRVFRVLRVIRLIEGLENAKRLVDTLVLTLPGIINISILLILLLFIYAALGMQLFATVGYFQTYDRHANFRSFGNSLLTLFRFTTGEGWGNYMVDVAETRANCDSNLLYNESMCGFDDHPGCTPLNGCGSDAIYPYLISFTIVVSMVIFNLFVGVILEGFGAANESNECLKSQDFKVFTKCWAKYDPNGGLFITIAQFEQFIATLPPPMGLADMHPSHASTVSFLSSLDLRVFAQNGVTDFVHFKDALTILSTKAIESNKGGDLDGLQAQINFSNDVTYKETLRSGSEVVKKFSPGDSQDAEKDSVYYLRDHYAALLVQHALRRHRVFKSVKKQIMNAGIKPGDATVQSIAALMQGSDDLVRRNWHEGWENPISKPGPGKRKTLLGSFWKDASNVLSKAVSPLAAGSGGKRKSEYASIEMTEKDDDRPKFDRSAAKNPNTMGEVVVEIISEGETKATLSEESMPSHAKLIKRQVTVMKSQEKTKKKIFDITDDSIPDESTRSGKASNTKEGRNAAREKEQKRVLGLMEENKRNLDELDEFSKLWKTTGEDIDDSHRDNVHGKSKAPLPSSVFRHASINQSHGVDTDALTVSDMLAALKNKREAAAQAQAHPEETGKDSQKTSSSPISRFLSMFVREPAEVVVYGEKVFANGDIYTGSMVNKVMHGYGFYQYVDGAVYEGTLCVYE